MENNGTINIGYYEDGFVSTGNFIFIYSDGDLEVGEIYFEDGDRRRRGTIYKTNGTEYKYDN